MISASQKRNIVPGLCELTVDCRLLPEQTQAEIKAPIDELLGDGDDFDWIQGQGGTRSPLDTPLWNVVESFVAEIDPGGAPRRSVSPDSRTATGCGRPSARSRTASSRCARWTPIWPRG